MAYQPISFDANYSSFWKKKYFSPSTLVFSFG